MSIRLSKNEIKKIKESFLFFFSENDQLWIFGSRVIENKQGGDIDLYIEMNHFDFEEAYQKRSNFWIDLQRSLGEQKIDIIIKNPKKALEIYNEARINGKRIV